MQVGHIHLGCNKKIYVYKSKRRAKELVFLVLRGNQRGILKRYSLLVTNGIIEVNDSA